MSAVAPDPMFPIRFRWNASNGPTTLHRELTENGIALLSLEGSGAGGAPLDLELAQRTPWTFVERLFGERPIMVERQTIRSLPNGRNFATGSMPAPFHTDSQCFFGAPPHVQLMICIKPASENGESRYLDGWSLLERLEREDPALLDHLFERHRRFRFVFGDFFGPTLSWRGQSLVFTRAPGTMPGDQFEQRLTDWLERSQAIELRAVAGDLIAIHNHRMLHGRRGFQDEEREFLRLLVWLRSPFPSPPRFAARATAVKEITSEKLADFRASVRRCFGLEPTDTGSIAQHRLELVLEMLRGVPPGSIARRERIPEPELYRWRDAALAAALVPLAPDQELEKSDGREEQELEFALNVLR